MIYDVGSVVEPGLLCCGAIEHGWMATEHTSTDRQHTTHTDGRDASAFATTRTSCSSILIAYLVRRRDVTLVLEQQLHAGRIALLCGLMQRSAPILHNDNERSKEVWYEGENEQGEAVRGWRGGRAYMRTDHTSTDHTYT